MKYFAYGANMNHESMYDRCSNGTIKFLKRVFLDGWVFRYRGYSRGRRGAVADIQQCEGERVWGGLWEIDNESLQALDRFEGYPSFYTRRLVTVQDDEGHAYEAWVYVMNGKWEEGEPSDYYQSIVVQGARDCGLPEDYIRRFLLGQDSTR